MTDETEVYSWKGEPLMTTVHDEQQRRKALDDAIAWHKACVSNLQPSELKAFTRGLTAGFNAGWHAHTEIRNALVEKETAA